MKPTARIHHYKWYELIGVYAGLAVFLAFILAPFFEGFMVSLKPLNHLFSAPYRFWPEDPTLPPISTCGSGCRCSGAISSTRS